MVEKDPTRFTIPQFIGIIVGIIFTSKVVTHFVKSTSPRTLLLLSNVFLAFSVIYCIWQWIITGEFPLHSKLYYWNKSPDIVVTI